MLCIAGMQLASTIAYLPILGELAENASELSEIPSELSVFLALSFVSAIFAFVLFIACLLNFILLLISKKAGFTLTRRVLAMTVTVLTIVSAVVTTILLIITMAIYFNFFSADYFAMYVSEAFIDDFVSSMIIYGAMTGVLIATFIKSLFYFFSLKSNNVELQ